MLSPTFPRKVLFACLPSPLWNPLSFSVKLTLSFSRSRSDPSLSRQPLAQIDFLPSNDLVIWTDGSVLFPFNKSGSGVLANFSLCDAEATLPILQAECVQVFPMKPAPFCKDFTGLENINKSAISLLLSDSRSVLDALSSPQFFPFTSNFLADLA